MNKKEWQQFGAVLDSYPSWFFLLPIWSQIFLIINEQKKIINFLCENILIFVPEVAKKIQEVNAKDTFFASILLNEIFNFDSDFFVEKIGKTLKRPGPGEFEKLKTANLKDWLASGFPGNEAEKVHKNGTFSKHESA